MEIKNGKLVSVDKDIIDCIIPDGVTEIATNAFADCKNLIVVKIPNTVTKIGENAFARCISLRDINIPDSVTEIGSRAFMKCMGLETIELPDSVTELNNDIFANCLSLNHIKLPKGITKISDNAFDHCFALSSIEIPTTVTEIGKGSFCDCVSLTALDLPDGLKTIGANAFYGCGNLYNIIIPEGVTEIGEKAFMECRSLSTIEIPKGITVISDNSFSGCENLTTVELPDGLKVIASNAFLECENLTNITIPNTVTEVGYSSFADCYKLTTIELPDSVKTIGPNAFSECENLTSITIPDTVTEIPDLFAHCDKLESITWAGREFIVRNILFPYEDTITRNELEKCQDVLYMLKKSSMTLPLEVIKHMAQNEEKFDASRLMRFNKRFGKLIREIDEYGQENIFNFCKFAYNIGCFSADQRLSQRACEWLAEQINNGTLPMEDMSMNFEKMPTKGENAEFSDFLMGKDYNEKKVTNLQKMFKLCNFDTFISRVYQEYQNPNRELRQGGRYRDKKNRLMFQVFIESTNQHGLDNSKSKGLMPTVELFLQYFNLVQFSGVETEQDQLIAAELAKWPGMTQEHFNRARDIIREFDDKVKVTNIVGTHLKNIENEIIEYKSKTEDLARQGLGVAAEILDQLGNYSQREFTYDWLEKNDPLNFCLGLYCNCCANLAGVGYGIMRANFVREDVQNLVVKNNGGNPVAKATLYVNKEQGYAVFNNVEVSSLMSDEEKDGIYEEFMAGVKSFAEAYNEGNPEVPLTKITVGMHLNDLENQIKAVENGHRPSEILKGINFGDYGIVSQKYSGDWEFEQYLLWEAAPSEENGYEE